MSIQTVGGLTIGLAFGMIFINPVAGIGLFILGSMLIINRKGV